MREVAPATSNDRKAAAAQLLQHENGAAFAANGDAPLSPDLQQLLEQDEQGDPSKYASALQEAPVERVLYKPENENWIQEEENLLEVLKIQTEQAAATLEPDPPGVDELFVEHVSFEMCVCVCVCVFFLVLLSLGCVLKRFFFFML